jgi:1-acyl-sn-glycerol-3-phosphate acyltransferase
MSTREFLLTGVTGFLGKVVLEEVVRRREELGVGRVHVMIRARKGIRAEERFRTQVASSPCFERLPRDWARWVSVVEGSLEEPGLGLDSIAQSHLAARVTHVLHAAASVSFDLPLDEAARANVTTSLNLLELARACVRLERLVCVSTAYVTAHPGEGVAIEEALAPLPEPAEEIYRGILEGRSTEAELLRRSGHPNTYTLTKSLAEHLLAARHATVPLSIVRPSIISASRQYPFPGWIDSTAGFGGFVVLIGLGHLRTLAARGDTRLDIVPVDEVVTRMLEECQSGRRGGALTIRHAVAGLERSPTVRRCRDLITEFYTVHSVDRMPARRYLGPPGLRFTLSDYLHHRLPIAAAQMRSPALRRSARDLRARLDYMNRVFPYFTSNSFAFRCARPLDSDFESDAYVRMVCLGVYRHILNRDDRQWTLAGRKHRGWSGDLRWAIGQPHGTFLIRFAAWIVTKVLRRAVEQITVDIPSFEAARRAAIDGSALVLVPNHRSYLDFVLCSYLCFARPDLDIPIPHVAAAIEFGRIPLLGRILRALQAFYLRRGEGREDPELTRRVAELIDEGKTLEFFIEGQRSRSREFLPPKRGLLRCVQATGRTSTLLPVAFSYDRVPEEAAFARELRGEPKPRMRLGALLRWACGAWRGRIQLGRVHLACGAPVFLHPGDDVREVSEEIIRRLQEATVATTYHLEAFLSRHEFAGLDADALRRAIEERGGRVLESSLAPSPDLDPLIAATLRHQFAHCFESDHAVPGPAPVVAERLAREPAA